MKTQDHPESTFQRAIETFCQLIQSSDTNSAQIQALKQLHHIFSQHPLMTPAISATVVQTITAIKDMTLTNGHKAPLCELITHFLNHVDETHRSSLLSLHHEISQNIDKLLTADCAESPNHKTYTQAIYQLKESSLLTEQHGNYKQQVEHTIIPLIRINLEQLKHVATYDKDQQQIIDQAADHIGTAYRILLIHNDQSDESRQLKQMLDRLSETLCVYQLASIMLTTKRQQPLATRQNLLSDCAQKMVQQGYNDIAIACYQKQISDAQMMDNDTPLQLITQLLPKLAAATKLIEGVPAENEAIRHCLPIDTADALFSLRQQQQHQFPHLEYSDIKDYLHKLSKDYESLISRLWDTWREILDNSQAHYSLCALSQLADHSHKPYSGVELLLAVPDENTDNVADVDEMARLLRFSILLAGESAINDKAMSRIAPPSLGFRLISYNLISQKGITARLSQSEQDTKEYSELAKLQAIYECRPLVESAPGEHSLIIDIIKVVGPHLHKQFPPPTQTLLQNLDDCVQKTTNTDPVDDEQLLGLIHQYVSFILYSKMAKPESIYKNIRQLNDNGIIEQKTAHVLRTFTDVLQQRILTRHFIQCHESPQSCRHNSKFTSDTQDNQQKLIKTILVNALSEMLTKTAKQRSLPSDKSFTLNFTPAEVKTLLLTIIDEKEQSGHWQCILAYLQIAYLYDENNELEQRIEHAKEQQLNANEAKIMISHVFSSYQKTVSTINETQKEALADLVNHYTEQQDTESTSTLMEACQTLLASINTLNQFNANTILNNLQYRGIPHQTTLMLSMSIAIATIIYASESSLLNSMQQLIYSLPDPIYRIAYVDIAKRWYGKIPGRILQKLSVIAELYPDMRGKRVVTEHMRAAFTQELIQFCHGIDDHKPSHPSHRSTKSHLLGVIPVENGYAAHYNLLLPEHRINSDKRLSNTTVALHEPTTLHATQASPQFIHEQAVELLFQRLLGDNMMSCVFTTPIESDTLRFSWLSFAPDMKAYRIIKHPKPIVKILPLKYSSSNTLEQLNRISMASYTKLLLLILVLQPTHDSPDNYSIVNYHDTLTPDLIRNNYDELLYSFNARQKSLTVNKASTISNSLLLHLDQIDTELDTDILRAFSLLDANKTVIAWLESLEQLHKSYAELYSNNDVADYIKQKANSFLPALVIHENIITHIIEQIDRINHIIRHSTSHHHSLTGRQLVNALYQGFADPFFGQDKTVTPLARYEELKVSLQEPRHIQQTTIPVEQIMSANDGSRFSASEGIAYVQKYYSPGENGDKALRRHIQNIVAGQPGDIYTLPSHIKNAVAQLLLSKEQLNQLQPAQKIHVLVALNRLHVNRLNLLYFGDLLPPRFEKLITQTGHSLVELRLENCALDQPATGADSESQLAKQIATHCKRLTILSFKGSSLIKAFVTRVPFLALHELHMDGCRGLQVINIIAHHLTKLSINNCINLNALFGDYRPSTIDADGCESINHNKLEIRRPPFDLIKIMPMHVISLHKTQMHEPALIELFRQLAFSLKEQISITRLLTSQNVNLFDKSLVEICSLALLRSSTIAELNLDRNGLEGESLSILENAISTRSTLQSLSLAGNRLDQNMGSRILANIITRHQQLTHLNLSNTHLGIKTKQTQQELETLVAALASQQQLTHLILDDNPLDSHSAVLITALLAMNIQHLSLSNTKLDSNGLAALGNLIVKKGGNLNLLKMNANPCFQITSKIPALFMSQLAAAEKLRSLHMSACMLTSTLLLQLLQIITYQTMQTLECLELSHNRQQTTTEATSFGTLLHNILLQLPRLQKFYIQDMHLSASDLAFIFLAVSEHKHLLTLDCRDNDLSDGAIYEITNYVAKNQSLQVLKLGSSHKIIDELTDASVQYLASMLRDPQLQESEVSDELSPHLDDGTTATDTIAHTDTSVAVNNCLQQLIKLDLQNVRLSTNGVKAFAESLVQNTTLTSLGITTDYAASAEGKAARENIRHQLGLNKHNHTGFLANSDCGSSSLSTTSDGHTSTPLSKGTLS